MSTTTSRIQDIVHIATAHNLTAEDLWMEAVCVEDCGEYLHLSLMGYSAEMLREAAEAMNNSEPRKKLDIIWNEMQKQSALLRKTSDPDQQDKIATTLRELRLEYRSELMRVTEPQNNITNQK